MSEPQLIVSVNDNLSCSITLLDDFYDMSSEAIWSFDSKNASKFFLALYELSDKNGIDKFKISDEELIKYYFGNFNVDKFEKFCKNKKIKFDKHVFIN